MLGTPLACPRSEKPSKKTARRNKINTLGDKPITPFPTGRISVCAFPGTSCQATIMQSFGTFQCKQEKPAITRLREPPQSVDVALLYQHTKPCSCGARKISSIINLT